MNETNQPCIFVTKKDWFREIYGLNIKIQIRLNEFNMLEYKKLIKRIRFLKEKQIRNNIPQREELIRLKEIQKDIFKLQLGYLRTERMKMNEINQNPDIDLPRVGDIKLPLMRKKFELLTFIYEMERALCQLEFMKDITEIRNQISLPETRQNNAKSPVSRKLFNEWALASNMKTVNSSQMTMNYTNFLFRRTGNENINKRKLQEFRNIYKRLEKDNFNLHMRLKKNHLKTKKCKFAIERRTTMENNSQFLHELESKDIINWETILNRIGINHLTFLNQNPIHKRAIIELFNLYLMPITEPFDDIFRLKREYYLLCISFILYDFNTTSMNYLPQSEGTSGFTAQTRINRNSIYKVENLLLKKYPKRSYMSSIYLFSFFIQKYLHTLNSSYVPDIENIFFHFTDETKSITKMNLAGRNRNRITYSINLYQLLTKQIIEGNDKYFFEINNFQKFFIEVLKKLCEILIFYQNECYFVHRDLHISNIMINFNLIDNQQFDLSNIEVKLIDFTYSSIVIFNREGQNSEFMNTNYNYFFDIKLSNPYLNKDWNKYDLKYLLIDLLFQKIYKGDMELLNENILINRSINQNRRILPIKIIRQILMNIFNIKRNYLQSYKLFKSEYIQRHNTQKCSSIEVLTYYELLFNNDILKNIMGDDFRFDLLNPIHLLNVLKKKNKIN